jgi:thiol:disulfide interchange protein DsbD
MNKLASITLGTTIALCSLNAMAMNNWFEDEPQFLPHEKAFVLTQTQTNETLKLTWMIQPGYYLYDHTFDIEGVPDKFITRNTTADTHYDEYFGDTKIHKDEATLTIDGRLIRSDTLDITYRGCAEAGLCYPPVTVSIPVDATGTKSAKTISGVPVFLITKVLKNARDTAVSFLTASKSEE